MQLIGHLFGVIYVRCGCFPWWYHGVLTSFLASRIIVGVAVAIPAASLCINRRLYKIASCQTVTITRAHVDMLQNIVIRRDHLTIYRQKRRAVMVDLAIGLGIPFLQMALRELHFSSRTLRIRITSFLRQ
jgi:hypothetical protein